MYQTCESDCNWCMGQIITKKNLFTEYLLVGFTILWSGGFFSYGLFPDWPYVLFLLALIILLKRGLKLEDKYIFVIFAFSLIAMIQSIFYKGTFTSIFLPTFRLLGLAMVAAIVRPNLSHIFIRITTFIAFFGLAFWIVDSSPAGHAFLLNVAKVLPQFGADKLSDANFERYGYVNYTLYFYTVSSNEMELIGFMHRNYGPFYEPGRFTIPLSIALAMILFTGNYKKYKTHFYIIFIANLTTYSTTGYLTMIALFTGYYIGRTDVSIIHKIVMLVFVIIIALLTMSLDFMGDKISSALNDTDIANSRFGAMYYHLPQIMRSPMIGHGAFLGKVYADLDMSPCGITDMMRRWGVPMFFVCVILLYQGTRSYLVDKRVYRIVFLIILLFNAYTQTVMFDPLYILLYFIGSNKECKQTTNANRMKIKPYTF